LRELRDAESNLQQRGVVGLGDLRRPGVVFSDVDPGVFKRNADLRRDLPVGRLQRTDVYRSRNPSLRQLRLAESNLLEWNMVRLVHVLRARHLLPDFDPSLWNRRDADLQRFLWLGPVYGSDLRRSFEPSLRLLREPDSNLQQRNMVELGDVRRRGNLFSNDDASVRDRRNADLQRHMLVGPLLGANMYGAVEPSLRKLRKPDPHMHQRHLVELGDLHGPGRVLAHVDPSLWNRRNPDLQRELLVGSVCGSNLCRSFDPSLRKLRKPDSNLHQRQLVDLGNVRW
jgi:hypothetical protein